MRKLLVDGDLSVADWDDDWERPCIVLEIGEGGSLYQLAAFDGGKRFRVGALVREIMFALRAK